MRDDGGSRVHPISPMLVEDGLYALVMVSPKLADLLRDGRFALHSFPHDGWGAFYLTGRVRFPEDAALRRTVAAAFLAERAMSAPPPGFTRHTLVEFLIEACVLDRDGRYVTWGAVGATAAEVGAPTDAPRREYTSSSHSE